ncbi:MAG TPA: Omp28-related outer membrane protein, partial [Candidatus Kapabacteria bacterium]|nr:Omp28-related outer membrane protein [Candidatus Kapabacteria bacterium]
MTKFNKLIALLFCFSLLLIISSCDEITYPYREGTHIDTTDTVSQKILLEDFTGFLCNNCPAAHELAYELKEQLGNQLVILAVHAGYYAKPNLQYTYDFRTAAGTEINDHFSVQAYPNGMFNRTAYNNKIPLGVDYWGAAINTLKNKTPKAKIELTPSYNETSHSISVDVKIKYLQQSSTNHYLVVQISEDSIVQIQLDKRKTPELIQNYVHNNVLRGSITSTWGDQVSSTVLPK